VNGDQKINKVLQALAIKCQSANPKYEAGMYRLDRGISRIGKQLSRSVMPPGKVPEQPNLVSIRGSNLNHIDD
jgi:hypothetical protein